MSVSKLPKEKINFPILPIQDGVGFAHIPKLIGYCVGDDGTVWGCRQRGRPGKLNSKWHKMKLTPNVKSKYLTVSIGNNGKQSPIYVHLLVLESFIGPCPDGMECCHYDDDRGNNRLSNLRWDTRKNNSADAYRNEHMFVGEQHQCAKLTESQVLEAINLRKQDPKLWTYKVLGRRYKVHFNTIMFAVKGINWSHLQ